MKKHLAVLTFLILAFMLIASPVISAGRETTGERLNLYNGGSQILAAGEPFHIAHGFLFEIPDAPPAPGGSYDFILLVDNDQHPEDFIERTVEPLDRGVSLTWRWISNFPGGLTGQHTFTGRWYGPCAEFAPDPTACHTPNEPVLALERETIVTFAE